MAQPRALGRTRYTLLVLVMLAVTLVTVDARATGVTDGARRVTMDAMAPLTDGVGAVLRPVKDVIAAVGGYDDLRRENDALRTQVEQLRADRAAVSGVRQQNDSLRALLDLPGLETFPTVAAEVAFRAPSNVDQTIEIDRGSSQGVAVGMPVVAAGSLLVGRVVEVASGRARVRLLTDPQFSVGVALPEVPEYGLTTGSGAGRDLELTLVDDPGTRPGAIVLTSGTEQSRSRVPKGLIVGVVSDVQAVEGELSLRASVRPSVDLDRLEFVSVVLWTPEEP